MILNNCMSNISLFSEKLKWFISLLFTILKNYLYLLHFLPVFWHIFRAPSCPEIPEIPEISQMSWNCPEIRNCPEILLIWMSWNWPLLCCHNGLAILYFTYLTGLSTFGLFTCYNFARHPDFGLYWPPAPLDWLLLKVLGLAFVCFVLVSFWSTFFLRSMFLGICSLVLLSFFKAHLLVTMNIVCFTVILTSYHHSAFLPPSGTLGFPTDYLAID